MLYAILFLNVCIWAIWSFSGRITHPKTSGFRTKSHSVKNSSQSSRFFFLFLEKSARYQFQKKINCKIAPEPKIPYCIIIVKIEKKIQNVLEVLWISLSFWNIIWKVLNIFWEFFFVIMNSLLWIIFYLTNETLSRSLFESTSFYRDK